MTRRLKLKRASVIVISVASALVLHDCAVFFRDHETIKRSSVTFTVNTGFGASPELWETGQDYILTSRLNAFEIDKHDLKTRHIVNGGIIDLAGAKFIERPRWSVGVEKSEGRLVCRVNGKHLNCHYSHMS